MPKSPEGVTYQTRWEDGECAEVEKLVCSCGTDLREGYSPDDYTVGHEEKVTCPKCKKTYQFIWHGMVLTEVT